MKTAAEHVWQSVVAVMAWDCQCTSLQSVAPWKPGLCDVLRACTCKSSTDLRVQGTVWGRRSIVITAKAIGSQTAGTPKCRAEQMSLGDFAMRSCNSGTHANDRDVWHKIKQARAGRGSDGFPPPPWRTDGAAKTLGRRSMSICRI